MYEKLYLKLRKFKKVFRKLRKYEKVSNEEERKHEKVC